MKLWHLALAGAVVAGVAALAVRHVHGAGEGTPAAPQPSPGASGPAPAAAPVARSFPRLGSKLQLSDDEWKERLTPEQYRILRKEATERAFTGPNWDNHASGIYVCAACGAPLFSSATKFDSGTGWPSFTDPIEPGRVATRVDKSWFMVRTECHCDRCGGHLGHVFPDGPAPTGLRYCMNGAALEFVPGSPTE